MVCVCDRGAIFEERMHKILHLYSAFSALSHDDEAYGRLLAIRKGVKVVARLLPLLPKVRMLSLRISTGAL